MNNYTIIISTLWFGVSGQGDMSDTDGLLVYQSYLGTKSKPMRFSKTCLLATDGVLYYCFNL